MTRLPDEALVVRGGENLPESFARGTGATLNTSGTLQGISVNAAAGSSVRRARKQPVPADSQEPPARSSKERCRRWHFLESTQIFRTWTISTGCA